MGPTSVIGGGFAKTHGATKARKDSGELFKKDGQGAQSDFQTHTQKSVNTMGKNHHLLVDSFTCLFGNHVFGMGLHTMTLFWGFDVETTSQLLYYFPKLWMMSTSNISLVAILPPQYQLEFRLDGEHPQFGVLPAKSPFNFYLDMVKAPC